MQSLHKLRTAFAPIIENPSKNAIALTEAATKYKPKQPIVTGVGMGGGRVGLEQRIRAGYLKWNGVHAARGKQAVKQHTPMFNSGIEQRKAVQRAAELPTGAKSKEDKITKTEVIPNAEIAGIAARLQSIKLAMGEMAMGFVMGGAAGMATTVISAAANGIAKLGSGFGDKRRNHLVINEVSKGAIVPAVGSNQTILAEIGTRLLGGMLPEQLSSNSMSSFVSKRVAPMTSATINSGRKYGYTMDMQRRAAAVSPRTALWQGIDRIANAAGQLQTTPNMAAKMDAMRIERLSEKQGSMQLATKTIPIEGRLYRSLRYNDDSVGGDAGQSWRKKSNSRQNGVGKSVHIHLDKPLIERFTIEVKDTKDGLSDFKRKVEEVLLEILNSANLIK